VKFYDPCSNTFPCSAKLQFKEKIGSMQTSYPTFRTSRFRFLVISQTPFFSNDSTLRR
jgi:hypothetical protein